MEVVIIWYVKIKIVRLIFVGCVWDFGSFMGFYGKDNLMFDVFIRWNNFFIVVFVLVGLMVYWRIYIFNFFGDFFIFNF